MRASSTKIWDTSELRKDGNHTIAKLVTILLANRLDGNGMKLTKQRHFNAFALMAIGIVGGALATSAILFAAGTAQPINDSVGKVDSSSSVASLDAINEPIDTISDLVRLPTLLERTAALHRLVNAADENLLIDFLEQSRTIKSSSLRHAIEIAVVRKLAAADPEIAISQLATLQSERHDELIAAIYSAWAGSNLVEAVSQAIKLDPPLKKAALRGILSARGDLTFEQRQSVARRLGNEQFAIDLVNLETVNGAFVDPESAWNSFVIDGYSNAAQTEHLIEVAELWINRDGIDVIDRISDSLESSTVLNAVVVSVLHRVARQDPADAFRQALGLKSSSRELALETIVEIWAVKDPNGALSAILGLDSEPDRQHLQEKVLQAWASNDPVALMAIIDQLPEDIQALAKEAAMFAIARISPEQATGFLAELTERNARDALAKEIATYWSETDVASALDWALNDEFATDILQAEVLMIVLANLATENPELAFTTARKQPIVLRGQYYRGLEVTVIQQLVDTDIEKALGMLSDIRNEGLTVSHAYSEVGRAMVRSGDVDRALKLGERLSERGRSIYNGSLMYQWALANPEDLLASIEGLPTAQLKEQAVRGLNRFNSQTKALTDEQLEYANSLL